MLFFSFSPLLFFLFILTSSTATRKPCRFPTLGSDRRLQGVRREWGGGSERGWEEEGDWRMRVRDSMRGERRAGGGDFPFTNVVNAPPTQFCHPTPLLPAPPSHKTVAVLRNWSLWPSGHDAVQSVLRSGKAAADSPTHPPNPSPTPAHPPSSMEELLTLYD